MTNVAVASREHWHELRARTIGGSDIASLFYAWVLPNGDTVFRHMFEAPPEGGRNLGCVSTYKTGYRLYFEKAKKLDPEPLDGDRILAGEHLEPGIAAASMKKWEWQVRKVHRYIHHPEVLGFGCSRDYEQVAPGWPPVEIKNVDGLIFRDRWLAEGETIALTPLNITLQVQHQMAGTDAPRGWVVACVGGNRFLRGEVPRDNAVIARLEEAVSAFWAAIRAGVSPDRYADFDTVADIHALGTKGRTAQFGTGGKEAWPEFDRLAARYARFHRLYKAAEERRDEIKAQLALRIADAVVAVGDRHRITWPAVEATATRRAYRGAFTVKELT